MKERLRKAIFFFFQKEIQEIVRIEEIKHRVVVINTENVKLETIREEIVFETDYSKPLLPPDIAVLKDIERAKENLIRSILPMCKVDWVDYNFRRSIIITLLVGKPIN